MSLIAKLRVEFRERKGSREREGPQVHISLSTIYQQSNAIHRSFGCPHNRNLRTHT